MRRWELAALLCRGEGRLSESDSGGGRICNILDELV